MKKVLKIFVLVALMLVLATTAVKAATPNEELVEELKKPHTVGGKELVISDADWVRIERYLSEHELTEAQKNTVLEKFYAIIDIMNAENVSDPAYLSDAKKAEAIKLAEEGAAALNLRLVADTKTNTIKIYDANGKLVESANLANGKLSYTGNNSIVYVVASVVAIIAVAAFVTYRKKVNA